MAPRKTVIRLPAAIERHRPKLPRYVVVPDSLVRPWRLGGTTVVEAAIDGIAVGRRTLSRWGEDRWFIDLTEALCRLAGVGTGDRVRLEIRLAAVDLPDEIRELLASSTRASENWERMSDSRRRMIGEHVRGGQRSETRENRARTAIRDVGADAEKRLAAFIAKFGAKDQRLIRAVRRAVRRRFPTANELVWDNYNFFVIGYSPTERPSDAIVSIAARANGVGLCFIRGAGLPDPKKLLLGSGNQTRFIRLESADVLARPEVEALVAAAIARAEVPLPAKGRGRLIIRSVAAQQRPRRRAAQ